MAQLEPTAPILPPPKPSLLSRLVPTSRCRLTLFGRSLFLLLGEFIANVILWVATVATFAPHQDKRGVLSLAVLAWSFGLRHGLDMGQSSLLSRSLLNELIVGR